MTRTDEKPLKRYQCDSISYRRIITVRILGERLRRDARFGIVAADAEGLK